MASKERQITGIDDSRPPERDPQPYETLHNLEIPNLAVTVILRLKKKKTIKLILKKLI